MIEISLVIKFHECLQSNDDQTHSTFLRKESDILEFDELMKSYLL